MFFSHIPRVRLAQDPTPLEHALRYGGLFNYEGLYIKRDDAFLLGMGGNKVRTLEFLLGEAVDLGADTIVAAGGLQSNQCRLAAAAAAKLGLSCVLVHNDDEPPRYQGNLLLDHLAGARSIFLGPVLEEDRERQAEEIAQNLKNEGHVPYIIKNSGRGALGYAQGAFELHHQAEKMDIDIQHVGMVGAMGATAAGFVYGTAVLGGPFHVHVISVEYSRSHLYQLMKSLWENIISITGVEPSVNMEEVMTIYDDYLGEGYAVPTDLSIRAAYELPRTEGIFLESVYTSKTLAGLRDLIEKKRIAKEEISCYVHTGGLPSLFTQADDYQP